jgi:hypothetical protein
MVTMNRTITLTVLLFLITVYTPLSCSNQSKDFEINGTVLVRYYGGAAKVTIPEGVTVIGEDAFAFCVNLTGVTIPASVTTIGDNAFSICGSLINITIPSSVTTIGDSAFSFCNSLISITIPSSVTAIGDYAFDGCDNLASVSVSSRTSIGRDAFPPAARITYRD